MNIKNNNLFAVLSLIFLIAMVAVPAFAETVSVSLDIEPADECVEGDTIEFTATAEGFTEPEYRFLYRVAGGTKIYTGQTGNDNVWETTAPAGSAGTYDVAVQVREAGTTGWPGIGDPGFDMFEGYEILVPDEPTVTLTIDPADTVEEGQEVTFTAESENVANPEYRFIYRASGGTKLYFPQQGPENVWTETAPIGSAGTWDFGVQVREEGTKGWPAYAKVEGYVITEKLVEPELEVVSVEPINDITVDFGTAFADLPLPEEVEVTLSDDSSLDVDIDWTGAEQDYDGGTAGTYTLEGDLKLPEGVINPDDLIAEVNVIVEEEPEEPAVLFAFDGVVAETGSEFTYTEGDSITVTLEEVLAGVEPLSISYEVREEDAAGDVAASDTVTDLNEGDAVYDGAVDLEPGTYYVVVTDITDDEGVSAADPDDIYYAKVIVEDPVDLALENLKANTTLDLDADNTVVTATITYPTEVDSILEEYMTDARIVVGDALVAGTEITVEYGGTELGTAELDEATDEIFLSELILDADSDASVRTSILDHIDRIDIWELIITSPVAIDTTIYVDSIVSNDGFVNWFVFASDDEALAAHFNDDEDPVFSWPEELEGEPLITIIELNDEWQVKITIKDAYVNLVNAVTILGEGATQTEDEKGWYAYFNQEITLVDLEGQILIDRDDLEEVDVIDLTKTKATYVGFFDDTYVRVYLKQGEEAITVTADGTPLSYNAIEDRWQSGALYNYTPGDTITFVATTAEGIQTVDITVED